MKKVKLFIGGVEVKGATKAQYESKNGKIPEQKLPLSILKLPLINSTIREFK